MKPVTLPDPHLGVVHMKISTYILQNKMKTLRMHVGKDKKRGD